MMAASKSAFKAPKNAARARTSRRAATAASVTGMAHRQEDLSNMKWLRVCVCEFQTLCDCCTFDAQTSHRFIICM